MSYDENTLKIISNETKDAIAKLDIVTPSIYASIFSQQARKYDLAIEDEISLSTDVIEQQCSSLQKMQEKTSKSAKELSEHTSKAIEAIESKDPESLKTVLHEIKTLKKEIEKLKESVYKDTLTQAYNRKWLHDHYMSGKEELFNTDGTIVIIDLNYFKQINDTYGHIIGDKVLIFITSQLKKVTKDVVRYGGDEFILLFEDQDTALIHKSIDELRERVLTKKLKAHNSEFHVSFSYGLHTFQKDDIFAQILEKADQSMYEDKINIKKRVPGIEV
jgi:diguanylate cyclase (GGDEF)-like protein